MINMDNYEGYLYLYQEGELDSQTRAEVERFLMEHPDIREEMDTYYDPTLVVTAEPPADKARWGVLRRRWSYAASIVVAMGLAVYLLMPSVGNRESLVATNKTSETALDSSAPGLPHTVTHESEKPRLVAENLPQAMHAPKKVLAHPAAVPLHPAVANQRSSNLETTDIRPENIAPLPQQANSVAPVATNPLPTSDVIYCDCLAVDMISVDNMAEDVPNSHAYPATQTNLASLLMASSAQRRQELRDFLFRNQPDQEQMTQLAIVIY